MALEEERNAAERQRTFLLHQRALLDQQLAQLENVSIIQVLTGFLISLYNFM